MLYRRLYIQIIIRVIFLLLSCLALAYVYVLYKEPIALTNLIALIIIQVFLMIRYLNRTNRDLANFFQAARIDDISFVKPVKPGKSYQKLWDALEQVNQTLARVKTRLERQNNYFKTVSEHIGTGLISFRDDGRVDIYNKAAQELLGLSNVTNIDAIRQLNNSLFSTIEKIEPGEQRTEKLNINGQKVQLSIHATLIKEGEKVTKLIALQDIKNELENNELDAWKKLIRVLNHEIMNSIAPINSTIATLFDYMEKEGHASKTEAKIRIGLEIIQERSVGLQQFVAKYRELTSLPKPKIEIFSLREMIESTVQLLKEEYNVLGIKMMMNIVPEDLKLQADKHLMEQVLINLIKNAMAANSNIIEISSLLNEKNQTIIQIKDDGKGIPEEVMDDIFIPFFTTKEEGMGVGLSLSREIMRMHGGSLIATSIPDTETVFTLVF